MSAGTAEIVTESIDTFTPTGLQVRSGQELAADIVANATGLNLLPLGRMRLKVDGEAIDLAKTLCNKGIMLDLGQER